MFLNGQSFEQLIQRMNTFEEKLKNRPDIVLAKYFKIQKTNDKSKCSICGKTNQKSIITPCNHIFHPKCIVEKIKNKQLKCQDCDKTYGNPPQPPGTFTKQIINQSCSGYEKTQTIEIVYDIPNGLQNGIHYRGTKQTCYIPNTKEGEELADLLKTAFDKGLVFTIGRSLQDGHKYQVQFNDLHHKTSLNGGKYGYPDATYINRMISELKQRLS
ncbi:unnamed protein product [Paramecium octaurelia]|uniref:RING-type domain-containing protein n=1 Tax=Paramecium octaurelia TaxID=43137 RepID=A0A8S1WH94_PAROT|nr:unnamed protein product [Paramecium octaurelia]